MGTKNTIVWDNEPVLASSLGLVSGVAKDALVSAGLSNVNPVYNSMRVTINYDNLVPVITGGRPFTIGAVVESEDDLGKWHNLGYQFTTHTRESQGSERVIVIQPNIDTFNLGVDDIVYPIDRAIARVSRQQGSVPAQNLRVRIIVQDLDVTSQYAFVSCDVSVEVEQYDV